MSTMLTLDKEGQLKTGISMMKVANLFQKIAKKNPHAVMNMQDIIVCLEKGYGSGNIVIETKGEQETIPFTGEKDQFLIVAGKSYVTIRNADTSRTYTMHIAPSGKYKIEKGDLSPSFIQFDRPYNLDETGHKIYDWLENGEIGASSRALVDNLYLVPNGYLHSEERETSHPYDLSDYRRCFKVLEEIPELKQDLVNMKQVSEDWLKILEKQPNENMSKWEESMKKIQEQEKSSISIQTTNTSNKGFYKF